MSASALAAADLASSWSWLIPVLTAVGAAVVGIYTARSARAANRETSQLSGWKALSESHSAEIKRLRTEREEDQEDHRQEREEDRRALAACHARIDDLTRRFEDAERRERELIVWAREVVRLMLAAEFPFPPPPPGVADSGPVR